MSKTTYSNNTLVSAMLKTLIVGSPLIMFFGLSGTLNAATDQTVYLYRNSGHLELEAAKTEIKNYVFGQTGVMPELRPEESGATNQLQYQPYVDAVQATPYTVFTPGPSENNEHTNSFAESVDYWKTQNSGFGNPQCADSFLEDIQGGPVEFQGWALIGGGWWPTGGLYGRRYSGDYQATLKSYSYVKDAAGNYYCREDTSNASQTISRYEGYQCTQESIGTILPGTEQGIPLCKTTGIQTVTVVQCKAPYNWENSTLECASYCPKGQVLDLEAGVCVNIKKQECLETVGDPIIAATGESYQPQSADYIGGGAFPIRFSRNYKSFRVPDAQLHNNRRLNIPLLEQAGWTRYVQPADYSGVSKKTGWNYQDPFEETIAPIGHLQWQHSYALSLYLANDDKVIMVRANGDKFRMLKQIDGITYQSQNLTGDYLVKVLDINGIHTHWVYFALNGIQETNNLKGQLILLTNPQGLTQSLVYDTNDQLTSITDPAGRVLALNYDANGRLNQLSQPDGNIITLAYDANSNLVQVTYPDSTPADITDNPQLNYLYSDSRHPYALTSQMDENGDQYAIWTFDPAGRAISSSNNNGHRLVLVGYDVDKALVTEANGQTRSLNYDSEGRLSDIAGGNCGQCSASDIANYTYNALHQTTKRTDFNGAETTFEYNSRGLQTKRTEAFGTAEAQVVTTVWHDTLSQPLVITSERLKTTFNYGINGRIEQVTETDLTVGTTPGRTTAYQYNTDGLLQPVIAPNGAETTYM